MDPITYTKTVQGTLWKPGSPGFPERLTQFLEAGDYDAFIRWVGMFQVYHGLVADQKLGPKTLSMMMDPFDDDIPLEGKVMWVWKDYHLGKSPRRAATKMANAGITAILIKVADDVNQTLKGKKLEAILEAFSDKGILVIPWAFAYCHRGGQKGDDRVMRQAELHASICRDQMGAPCFIINAEKGFKSSRKDKQGKRLAYPDFEKHATMYTEAMRQAGVPLALSSYGRTKYHGDFAWKAMADGVDFLMPQAYWSVRGPRKKPDVYMDEGAHAYRTMVGGKLPIIPSGGCYQVKTKDPDSSQPRWNGTYHRPKDITRFFEYALEMGLQFVAMYTYLATSGNARMTAGQWKAIADFRWPDQTKP